MKATLSNYRQSPRKVRLVANAIKGKSLVEADLVLSHMTKRGSLPILKLIKSAAANAANTGTSADSLMVKNIEVNKGIVLKRSMPRAQGRATPINKRSSHITVTLGVRTLSKKRVAKTNPSNT